MRNVCLALALVLLFVGCSSPVKDSARQPEAWETVELSQPRLAGSVSVEEALRDRRSVREYSDDSLSLEDVSQLLWAAQGVTADWGGRTAPSAGALYPLELYLASVRIEGLAAGVYRYVPNGHELVVVRQGDVARELADAALGQGSVGDAAAVLAFTAVYERTTAKYAERGMRYVHMEAGHAAQNALLQATALGLGCVVVGAFDDDALREVLNAPLEETPLCLIPVGALPAGSS
jgi:SagB-type dehydrogenase family enzyme